MILLKVLFDNFDGIGMDLQKYLPQSNSDTVYHYTPIGNWQNILLPCEKESFISFIASRIDSLNDYMENQFATKIYKEVLDELLSEGVITFEQKDLLENVKADSKIPMKNGINEKYEDCYIYVLCFSKNKDLLNMWKYYSKSSGYEAISIGLSNDFVDNVLERESPHEIIAYPVVYDEAEQRQYIRSFLIEFLEKAKEIVLIDDVDFINTFVADALSIWNVLFKSVYFSDEQEVRAVLFLPKSSKEVKYRTSNQLIIPYVSHLIDKNCVKEICVGPLDFKSRKQNVSVLQEALKHKFPDINIDWSKITLRF